jgi:hypothetical protein
VIALSVGPVVGTYLRLRVTFLLAGLLAAVVGGVVLAVGGVGGVLVMLGGVAGGFLVALLVAVLR